MSEAEQSQRNQQAKELAEVFQRSSSNVEGRNGYLSLRNHQLRGLDRPRKRACLTAIHNFSSRGQMGQLQRSDFSGRSLAPCLPRYWIRSRYHLPPSVRLGEPWSRLKGHRVAGAVIKARCLVEDTYVVADTSRVLPGINASMVARFIEEARTTTNQTVWFKNVVAAMAAL